jgi:hypothetical protein
MLGLIVAAVSALGPGEAPPPAVESAVRPPAPGDKDFPKLDAYIASVDQVQRYQHAQYAAWRADYVKAGKPVPPEFERNLASCLARDEAFLKELRRFRRERTTPDLERWIGILEERVKQERVGYERYQADRKAEGLAPTPLLPSMVRQERALEALRGLRGQAEVRIEAGVKQIITQMNQDEDRQRQREQAARRKYLHEMGLDQP